MNRYKKIGSHSTNVYCFGRNFGIDYRVLKVIMKCLFGVLAGMNLLFCV